MMEQQDDNAELFDRYLLDQMEGEEKAQFLEKLGANDRLSKEFETYQLIFQGINYSAARELKEKLVAREEKLATKANYSFFWKIAAAIGLIAVAAFFVIRLLPGEGYQELYLTYYEPYPNIVNPLDRSATVANDDVYRFYERGQYQQTVDYFQQWDASKFTDTTYFYLGQAYMALGKPGLALDEFKEVEVSSIFFEPSQWYIALVYLQQNKKNQLEQQLRKIIGKSGSYKKRAQELLDNL